jgi:hypothetical protein
MPDKSMLYDRIIPLVLMLLTGVMLLLILFAFGVLTGLVSWT